jgi:hypothetical protein
MAIACRFEICPTAARGDEQPRDQPYRQRLHDSVRHAPHRQTAPPWPWAASVGRFGRPNDDHSPWIGRVGPGGRFTALEKTCHTAASEHGPREPLLAAARRDVYLAVVLHEFEAGAE